MIKSDAKMNFCARHFKYCDVRMFLFVICSLNFEKTQQLSLKKPKLDDLDKKGERFASAINARKSSSQRRVSRTFLYFTFSQAIKIVTKRATCKMEMRILNNIIKIVYSANAVCASTAAYQNRLSSSVPYSS